MGQPRVRLTLSADAPQAMLSVKLCDVFADGTSALVARGSLDLRFRDGVHGPASDLVPGRRYVVELDLDACAYAFAPGQRLRLSVAGADWPNTVAPPAPVTLTVHAGSLLLPLHAGSDLEPPTFAPGARTSSEDPGDVDWTVSRDVLRATTTCAVRHGADYPVPYDGHASEAYAGEVTVDRRTFGQVATADCTFTLRWPEVEVSTHASLEVAVTADGYHVAVSAEAREGDRLVGSRSWRERLPR